MDVLNKSGLQTQISYIKAYVNNTINQNLPEEYTADEVVELWEDYFHPPVTVTIVQSDNQTIHVLINGETDHTETFIARTDDQYEATVVADEDYAAGTVDNARGTISEDITISATAAILIAFSLYDYADQHITNRSSVTTLPDENIAELTNITLGANASLAFWYCFALTSLSNVEQTWNTSNVTDMSRMFISCQHLSTLNTSNWDTGNVTTMASMFEDCTALTSISGISDWHVSNVQTMESMFRNCINLRSLDLSSWETNSLTNMSYMFYEFSQYIRSLDLSNFNTDNVVNMDNLFNTSSYTSLYAIDLSGWNTTSVESMVNIFGDSNSGSSSSIRYIIIDTQRFQFPLTNSIYLHNYCKILVPQDLISTYQADTYWSEHASKFDAIENYTITRSDGTVSVIPNT